MNTFGIVNIDFFILGIALAANIVLGLIVFLRDTNSATSKLFLAQTIILSVWSVVTYASYQIHSFEMALLTVRLVMFSAVINSVIFMFLMKTFPNSEVGFSRNTKIVISCIALATMVISLTPLLFSGVEFVPDRPAPQPIVGPGIALFIFGGVFPIPVGFYYLLRRYFKSQSQEKAQLKYLLLGVVITFSLIIIFDFIFPSFLGNTRFIPFSAFFTLPFVVFTFYAIVRHGLLNIKVIATEILTFILAVVTLVEIIISQDLGTTIFRSGIFALVLSFGILLIRSVRKEVEQREKLEVLTKDLEAANLKLKELDKLKSEFLSFASHQIKSPVSIIKGFAELIYDGSYGKVNKKIKETAGRIADSANRLISLVEEFLDLRKIEEGKMTYNLEDINIAKTVEGVFNELKPMAESKELKYIFKSPKEPLIAKIDLQKIRHVVQNLIDNAIKYTDEGWVTVEVIPCHRELSAGTDEKCQKEKAILIQVSDSGRGISKKMLPELFEQFSRDDSLNKDIKGSGLGLYIAKQIVSDHDGEISAESEGEGKGSKFTVRLPLIEG